MDFLIDIFVLIVAVLLIIVVMLQGSKDDINDAFNGSKSELFKNQKTRGVELFMRRTVDISQFYDLIIQRKKCYFVFSQRKGLFGYGFGNRGDIE